MKALTGFLGGLLGFAFCSAVLAQPWPAKPVRIIAPFAPGGVADSSARVISERLGARLGQSVVVENRPGAAGNIGTAQVAQSAPDGYTLLLGFDGTMVVNPHVYAKLPFDTLRDFAPVTKLGDATLILVAHPSVPAKDLRELLAFAEDQSNSPTAPPERAARRTWRASSSRSAPASRSRTCPTRAAARRWATCVGGQIPLVFTAVATAQQFVKSGKLRGLGVPGAKRSGSLPEVPTFVESGLAGFVVDSWVGILAPAKTPRPVIDRLQKDIAAVLARAADRASATPRSASSPSATRPEQFTEQIRADLARWEKVVQQARIKIE